MKKLTYIGKSLMLMLIVLALKNEAKAQLNPMEATYFRNQYLGNPALTGMEKGLSVEINYRQQWSSIKGAPGTQTFTSEYGFNDKVSLGASVYNDRSGLLRRTRVMGTYAYHLPLSGEGEKLSFGISFGFMSQWLENSEIYADQTDGNIGRYNAAAAYIDGDFGLAYTSNKFSIQAAVPNMKSLFSNDDETLVDRSTFFTAVSYKLYYENVLRGFSLEPKLCFRGVKGHDNIADIGTSLGFSDNAIHGMLMYHTNESTTFSLGVNYNSALSITGSYTTSTAALSSYANGSFEVGVRGDIGRLKKK